MKDFRQRGVVKNLILGISFKEVQQQEVSKRVVNKLMKIIPMKWYQIWQG